MTTTLNASNSGSGGLVATADASGVLALQTAGVTAVTIDTSQRTAFVAGTAALPAITTTGDTNTGIFFPAADQVATTVGGTEGMRLTSTGLGIGTTSPSYKLDVSGAASATPVTNGIVRILTTGSNPPTGYGGGLLFTQVNSGGTNQDYASITGSRVNSSANNKVDLVFSTGDPTGSIAVAERMRIDTSGNVLVGRTSLVGTERLSMEVDGSKQGQIIRSTNTSGNPQIFRIATGQFSGGIGTGRFITCDDGGGDKFFVAGSGVVNSTSTSITSISDFRLKENVRVLDTGLNSVMALKPRRFDWKEGQGTNKKNVAGFIAQEVETVLPDLIGEWKNNENDETTYKSLSMGDMLPTLVKAIQEQQALITSLTARIAALEGTPA